MKQADANNIWRNMVSRYTNCNLTNSEDKLMALAGVAVVMAKGLEERYLAGLWDAVDAKDRKKSDLPNQLGWWIKDGGRRYEEYRAPTWSWACLNGVAMLQPRIEHYYKYEAEITHAYVHLKDEKIPTGPVRAESTCLEISGKMIKALKFMQKNGGGNIWRPMINDDAVGNAHLDDDHDLKRLLYQSRSQPGYEAFTADMLTCP
jgi:hypothetical protein